MQNSQLSVSLILLLIGGYFLTLMLISWWKSRNAGTEDYFMGGKSSPWYLVAFGMIGDSLSGVTFVSVPGEVGVKHFAYLQLVFGYLIGYQVIARVLLPLYYKMNLTSIYAFLGNRFGGQAQITGSVYFILSRSIGAAFRLFISANVLQIFLFDPLGIPFSLSVSLIILLIVLYTLKGGIKSLVWTDTFQSLFLLLGVVLTAAALMHKLDWSFTEAVSNIYHSKYAEVFHWEPASKLYFWKQFISGVFIAIVMTGLDQNMMQKNLSCRTLPEAQKNIQWFSLIVVIVNVVFLSLGALMYLYSESGAIQMPEKTDAVLPFLVRNHLGYFAAGVFLLGIIAATFSSADSVLTTLTTSFYYDILHFDTVVTTEVHRKKRIRSLIHACFAVLLLLIILIFKAINNDSVISGIFTAAGYTYGPLLGLFAYGILMKRPAQDKWIPLVCILAPLLSWLLSANSESWFGGYQIGFELLLINGALTFIGLHIISKQSSVD
jgi:SSS family transporter